MFKFIVMYIFNKYAVDMGNWFDYIKDDQEGVIADIEHILKHGTIRQKIQLLKGDY